MPSDTRDNSNKLEKIPFFLVDGRPEPIECHLPKGKIVFPNVSAQPVCPISQGADAVLSPSKEWSQNGTVYGKAYALTKGKNCARGPKFESKLHFALLLISDTSASWNFL